MEIRRASKEDIKSVSRVYIESWRNTYRGLIPDDYLDTLSYEEAETKWINFLNNENEPFIFVAMNDVGNMIGFAAGQSVNDKKYAGELYSLYLLQEAKGLGIGRKLISVTAKHFREKGIYSMMVWVMRQNKSGLGFYEHMGGEEYIHRTSLFGGTEVEDVAYGWKNTSKLCTE